MQGKVYEIPLDISSGVLTTQIRTLVTEDMGTNTFRFKVVRDNHVPYDFTGTIVRMMVKTPSGARIQQECTIENAVGGTVSLTLKQSLLLEHGSYIAELQIFDAITQSIRLTTPTFTYHVRQSLQNSESIVATDEYTILQETLADLAGINIVVDDIRQEVEAVKLQSNEIATHTTKTVSDGVHGLGSIASQIYQEGVWIPSFEFGGNSMGIVVASQKGRFTRKGNTVSCDCNISISNKGSSTGALRISGLPIASSNEQPVSGVTIGDFRNLNLPSDALQLGGLIQQNSTSILLRICKKTGESINVTDAEINNNTQLYFSFSYKI